MDIHRSVYFALTNLLRIDFFKAYSHYCHRVSGVCGMIAMAKGMNLKHCKFLNPMWGGGLHGTA